MKLLLRPLLLLIVCSFSLLLINCGGDTANKKTDNTKVATKKKEKKKANKNKDFTSSENDGREVVKLEISGNDAMQYDKKELKVPAGTRVELTLKHTGKMRGDVMGHNLVILKQGIDMAEFSQKAVKARANDYIPADSEAYIAHTAMIGGGETSTVLFDAPEKGTYDFICTFPGHFINMSGKLIVE